MQLLSEDFDEWLADIGQRFLWRKSYQCPCVNPHSGAASPGCPRCGGKGRFWDAPIASVAGAAGQRTQREWAQFSVWESGDVVVTIPSNTPMYSMGQFDRATMLNAVEQFQTVMVRGQSDVLFGPVERVTRVFWLDGDSNIIDGGLPTVSDDGVMTWLDGAPPPGVQYTVCGTRLQEYFCYQDLPSNRNEHGGMRLPRRVVLRRFDLFGR